MLNWSQYHSFRRAICLLTKYVVRRVLPFKVLLLLYFHLVHCTKFKSKLELPAWLLNLLSWFAHLYGLSDHIFPFYTNWETRILLGLVDLWLDQGKKQKVPTCLIGSQSTRKRLPAMPNTARTGMTMASMTKAASSLKAFSSTSLSILYLEITFLVCSNLRKVGQQTQWKPNCFCASPLSQVWLWNAVFASWSDFFTWQIKNWALLKTLKQGRTPQTIVISLRKQDHQWWRYHRGLLDYQSPYFQLIIK